MINSGIYAIKNTLDGKLYIGSSVNLSKRRQSHFYKLRKDKHKNPHLQNAFNKYGKNRFTFAVLCYCPPEKDLLESIERYYIDKAGGLRETAYGFKWKL